MTTPARSALALWRALVQERLDQGYSTMNADEAVNQAHPGLWQQAVAEHAAHGQWRELPIQKGTDMPPLTYAERQALLRGVQKDVPARVPPSTGAPRRRAWDEIQQLAKSTTDVAALEQVCHARPDLWARHRQDVLQGGGGVAVAKAVERLTVPPPTEGQMTFEAMVEAMMRANPGMSAGSARDAVVRSEGGAAAWERHRQEHLFGRRG
jgi:hypothetical protein